MTRRADVWVLLGPHKGDNNQLLALADGLRRPYRTIQMGYRWFGHLPAVFRGATLAGLDAEARREIAPPWPSLVIGIGQRSVPVARYIQNQTCARTKIVRLGDPMVSHGLFDLVITTTQYAVRDGDNVIRLPITITNQDDAKPTKMEERWLSSFARPRRLLVIGGKTSLWRFDEGLLVDTIETLQNRARNEGGSVIAVTSPRTSPGVAEAAQKTLGETGFVINSFPRYSILLQAADEIHVTGDSVSMVSDAVASGKPVGVIRLEPDRIARFVQFVGDIRGRPFRMRDLEKFWNDLDARGLVGTVEQPRCGVLDIFPTQMAIEAVLATMDGRAPDLSPSLYEVLEDASALPAAPEPVAL